MPKTGFHFEIPWQNGLVPEVGVNGVQIEDVIELVRDRVRELNEQYPCRENALTITKLDEAAMWQRERTRDREARGVEGKNVL